MNTVRLAGFLFLIPMMFSGCDRMHEARGEKLREAAIQHYANGELEKALEVSEIAIRLGADDFEIRGIRGTILLALADPEKALSEFDRALLRAEENDGDEEEISDDLMWKVYDSRAQTLQILGRYEECFESIEKALEINEESGDSWNNLGWALATLPEDGLRSGDRAVEAATKACELTEWSEAAYVDTLAAAYAENDDFSNAVKWQKKAIALLGPDDDADQDGFTDRLALYKKKAPYREDPREQYEEALSNMPDRPLVRP